MQRWHQPAIQTSHVQPVSKSSQLKCLLRWLVLSIKSTGCRQSTARALWLQFRAPWALWLQFQAPRALWLCPLLGPAPAAPVPRGELLLLLPALGAPRARDKPAPRTSPARPDSSGYASQVNFTPKGLQNYVRAMLCSWLKSRLSPCDSYTATFLSFTWKTFF